MAVSQFDWALVRASAEAVLAFDLENKEAKAYLEAAQRATEHSSTPPTSTPQTPGVSTPATTSDQPSPFANGRYQVTRLLGEGGTRRSTWPTTLYWTGMWPSPSSRPRAWTRLPERVFSEKLRPCDALVLTSTSSPCSTWLAPTATSRLTDMCGLKWFYIGGIVTFLAGSVLFRALRGMGTEVVMLRPLSPWRICIL